MKDNQVVKTKLNTLIEEYAQKHTNKLNRSIQWICVPMISFGLLGFIWSIPFPYLEFFGKYNGYINWASLLIAFTVYYYNTLSPAIAFAMIWVVFAFSAGIVVLEKMHTNYNWPAMGSMCLAILIAGLVIQFLGYQKESKMPSAKDHIKSLLIGPMWLVFQALSKLRIIRA